MPLPIVSYLLPGSPPRSPHVAPPGYFESYFKPSSSSNRPPSFRPTRRDILLCLLTISFSYLLFSSPQSSSSAVFPFASSTSTSRTNRNSASSSDSGYFGKWNFFSQSDSCPAVSEDRAERTFGESVQTHGFTNSPSHFNTESVDVIVTGGSKDDVTGIEQTDLEISAEGTWWEEGEDEDEDDELENGATVLRGFQPGWTLVDRLYLYNGSFYVVTAQRSDWPELRLMTSTGLPALNEPGNLEAREPRGDEIQFITPQQAAKLWGPRVYQMEGTTFLFNDGQFIDHYYHFTAELLMGAWRAYTSLDPDITPQGETKLPPPRRMWFLHQDATEWRDRPRFNPTVLFGLFPSISLLYPEDFQDLKTTTTSHQPKAYVMERALLADRSAAFRGPYTGPTARTVASAMKIGTASRWWWEPIRRQILRYSGVSEEIIDRSLEGFGSVDPATIKVQTVTDSSGNDVEQAVAPAAPAVGGLGGLPGFAMGDDSDHEVSILKPLAPVGTYRPLVTYISRQNSRRHLTDESHKGLVAALEKRSKALGFELVVVAAETLSKEEQIALAARTTIMLGVHGNGLTHLVWMPATPRSAVIELFYKGGFARDYQWTAHALGIKHFGVQHDVVYTAPNIPSVAYPEGFQGPSITVDGEKVADIIEARLAGRL